MLISKNIFLFIIILVSAISCKPAAKVVDVFTSAILEPVTFETSLPPDLGEISVGSDPLPFIITITNNSSDPITKMKLDIGNSISVFNYAPDADSNALSPGFEGTCGASLASHSKCTYNLIFNARKAGQFNIPVKFSYENLIQPDSKAITVTALTGEPAALAFTNDISRYDFGVIEQTIPIEKIIELEIKNVGGLSAKNITYILTNDNSELMAYRVVENLCPAKISPQKTCKIKIGYMPKNNNYSDPEAINTGKIVTTFQKDSSGKTDKLNAFFTFISSTIEAKISTNYKTVDFGQIVTGNNLKKSVKVSNNGYNVGIIKSITFLKSNGTSYATCVKGSGKALNCNKSLYDFPFIIEDNSACFEVPVKGIIGKSPGDSCYFDITYWPSRQYLPGSQAAHDFKTSNLSLTYDSRWLDKENIVTKDKIFDINADFIAGGKLVLDSILVEDQLLPAAKITKPNDTTFEADLGRIAKIADVTLDTYFKITLKNVGESPINLISLTDGALTPHQITEQGYDLNLYYKAIKYSSCGYIAPGGTCNFNYSLTPLVQANSVIEDNYMYDNTSNPLRKYKKFIFSYDDGSTLEDNGAPSLHSSIEMRLIAKLIAKGYLAYIESLTQTVPSIINGNSITKIINLKNAGTGDIYAISHHATNNLFPKSGNYTWPFRIIPLGTVPLPSTKDCYNLLYPAGKPLATDKPDITKFLSPGQSCALGIEIKASDAQRQLSTYYSAVLNHERLFGNGLNNTTDLWPRVQQSSTAAIVTFNYYDGDANSEDPISLPFGYLSKTKDMNLSASFSAPPNINVRDPLPTMSAVIARPAMTYPNLSMTYPQTKTLASYSTPEAYFESSYFTSINNAYTSSSAAVTHVKAMGIVGSDQVFHMGTFAVGSTNYAQFTFKNIGSNSATNVTITEASNSSSPITIYSYNGLTTKPFPTISMSPNQTVFLRLKFTPTAAGTFSRCYQLDYNNQIGNTWSQNVCAYAEALTNTPKLKIEYQDINVVYNAINNTVTETPSGVWNTLNSPINVPMNGPLFAVDTSTTAAFASVKGSSAYALKLFRITNIGTATATKVNYSFLSGANSPTTPISEITTISSSGTNPTCTTNMTILATKSCELYIKYKPLTNTTSVYSPFLGFTYDMGSGLNQFASQTSAMQFSAIDPAKLVVVLAGVSSEAVTDWSNPATPIPQSVSWPINLNNYSTADTHMITTTKPTTKIITNIPVNNTSTLKASFLAMNPTPVAGTWNVILSNSSVIIRANRYCFYGDDENNAAIAAADKGFNSTSVNKCNLQVEFSGDTTFQNCSAYNAAVKTKTVILGGRIQATCNPFVYTLLFYNYKRASTEKLYLHMKGFIEPNRTIAATTTFTNVTSTALTSTTGSATFTWPAMTVNNSAYGAITKYRIYYSTNYSDLRTDNIFFTFAASPVLSYADSTNALQNNVVIPNLTQGKYYFFRVAAIRTYTHPTYGALTYVSIPSNLPILTVPIPTSTYTYSYSLKAFIDKSPLPTTGSRTAGINACLTKKFDLNIVGTAKQITKSLVNTTVWNYLSVTPAASSGYPNNDVGTMPHWLSDSAYNIKTSLSLYNGNTIAGFPGYLSTSMSGNNSSLKLIYSKTCNNTTACDLLYKVVGGDNQDLYYLGTYYVADAALSANHRCYSTILCPTNTAKLFTDVTCADP